MTIFNQTVSLDDYLKEIEQERIQLSRNIQNDKTSEKVHNQFIKLAEKALLEQTHLRSSQGFSKKYERIDEEILHLIWIGSELGRDPQTLRCPSDIFIEDWFPYTSGLLETMVKCNKKGSIQAPQCPYRSSYTVPLYILREREIHRVKARDLIITIPSTPKASQASTTSTSTTDSPVVSLKGKGLFGWGWTVYGWGL